MAKGNYRDYLQTDEVKIKKYFYVLRPVLACKWIEKYNSVPPVEFQALVADLIMDGPLKNEINTLLDRKIRGDELNLEPKVVIINEFLENEINRIEDYAKKTSFPKQDISPILDELFRDILDEVWP